MPVNPNFPGVYLEEVADGARRIAGVGTSIAAFAGAAARGPVNVPVRLRSFADYERSFGGLHAGSEMSYGVHQFFQNGGTEAWAVRIVRRADAARRVLRADDGSEVLRIIALDPGVSGNDIEVRVSRGDVGNSFDLAFVRHGDGAAETYRDLSMDESGARYACDVVNAASLLVRLERVAAAPALDASTPTDPPPTAAVGLLLAGGSEEAFAAPDIHTSFIGHRPTRQGLYALEAVELFNLLVLPGVTDAATLVAAEAFCRERRAFLLIDAPLRPGTGDEVLPAPADMLAMVAGTTLPRSDLAAVYYPWIYVADPLANGALRLTAPSGSVAGLYARTDAERGVWKAPAGPAANLRGAQAPAYPLTDRENGALNPLGVNGIRLSPTHGVVCWGARTLAGPDQNTPEYKYVPVRRLALFIEESLSRGIRWAVFEPNGEALWAQIRDRVAAFMDALFRQGALQGRSPSEAYVVKCDSQTTTQHDIDSGIVNLMVGFAPLKPAEFVVIRLQQLAGRIEP